MPERPALRMVLGQLAPRESDPRFNAERSRELIAASRDADLVVFPELFLTGYQPERAFEGACALDGPELAAVARGCAEAQTAAIVGFAERVGDGDVANSIACLGASGELVAVYRKTHLFGSRERRAFMRGNELIVASIDGLPVGLLICFDVEFPEPARTLARAGARLLVTCSANMAPYGPCHELAVRARAMENQIPHVYVNRVGSEAGERFIGQSAVVDHDGNVVARLGPGEETMVAEVSLDPDLQGEDVYLDEARPDLQARVSNQ